MQSSLQGSLAVAGLRDPATTIWHVGQITCNIPSSRNP